MIGCHVGIKGGFVGAANEAARLGCGCMQIFVSQPRRWPNTPEKTDSKSTKTKSSHVIPDEEVSLFRNALRDHTIVAPIAHASYLINLGSPDDALWKKSMDALAIEWRRADQLKLDGLVMHPGACITSTPDEGLARIAEAVEIVLGEVQPKFCRLLFENTAGQVPVSAIPSINWDGYSRRSINPSKLAFVGILAMPWPPVMTFARSVA